MSQTSYAEAINSAAQTLKIAGIDDARFEARSMFLHLADMSGTDLISVETDQVPAMLLSAYNAAIKARCTGIPFQHIVGITEFYGLEFMTDARALIPRPDSECVVELALIHLPQDTHLTVADLGSGTGALLAAILYQRPSASGIAIERSADAARLAKENLSKLDLSKRANVLNQSWTDWLGWIDCDLIISNPPYIESAVIPTLQPEVRDHDPMDALDGGTDGLDAYREIIALGERHMKPSAYLVLEIGYDQKDRVTALLKAAGFVDLQHRKDLGGNDRAIAAKRP